MSSCRDATDAMNDEAALGTVLSIVYGWVALLVFATFVKNSTLLSTLSIKRSWDELLQQRSSKLNCLDYLRVFAILWVMVNHIGSEGRLDVLERRPSAKLFKHNVHSHPFFGPLFGNSGLSVEIFSVLSGLLAARSWHRYSRAAASSEHTPLRSYACFLLKRLLRLWPSVAVFVWIAQGPIAKQLLPRFWQTMISACGWKGLVAQLTFLGNWQENPTCLGYLWYLGLDMQMYALIPIFVWTLSRGIKRGTLLALGLVLISAGLRAYWCILYDVCNKSDVDIPFISYPNQTSAELAKIYAGLWDIYSKPCSKCGAFLIGLLGGHLTTVVRETPAIGTWTKRVLNTVSVLGIAWCIFGILPEYWHPDAGTTLYNVFYTATFLTTFAACVTWLIIYSVYWNDAPYSRVVSVLAQITFQAYLIHMPIVYLFNELDFLQRAESAWAVLATLPMVAVLSYATALLLFLFVEAPMAKLTTHFYRLAQKRFSSEKSTE
ncbi:CRE-RHY-1 protein [Aphelenchoides avenae]|nr:CRE-RHY-1 protein [Aphelenchus avenae]